MYCARTAAACISKSFYKTKSSFLQVSCKQNITKKEKSLKINLNRNISLSHWHKMLPMDDDIIPTSEEVPSIQTATKPKKTKHAFVLYLQFHKKLTGDRPKAVQIIQKLNDKIVNVRLPRQKLANYCLVDFLTKEDMEAARSQLATIKIHGKPIKVCSAKTQKLVRPQVAVPNTDEATAMKPETKTKVKNLIENINRSLARNPNISQTNCVVMKNIPKTIQESDVKRKFPSAIEFRFIPPKHGLKKMIAAITLPTPQEAYQATKKCVIINGEVFFLALQKDSDTKSTKEGGASAAGGSKFGALRKGGSFPRYYTRDVDGMSKVRNEREMQIYE